MKPLLIILIMLICSQVGTAQHYARGSGVGFRDPIGAGLSAGTMNGPIAEFRWRLELKQAIRIEGNWGIGVARWGVGEEWQITSSLIYLATDDGINDALLLEPGVSYGVMYGDSLRGFLDLRLGATVHFVAMWSESRGSMNSVPGQQSSRYSPDCPMHSTAQIQVRHLPGGAMRILAHLLEAKYQRNSG